MNIYLVGFMGTGKTAVGKQLSIKLNRRFIDLDSLIEIRQGRTIREIFSEQGEGYFRVLEKQILTEISKTDDLVVSCGGGIVLDADNINIMKDTGLMVCLSCRPDVILARTEGYRHRPLLNVDDPEKKIRELLSVRAPFYAQAHYTIDTSDLDIPEVIGKILEYIRTYVQKKGS